MPETTDASWSATILDDHAGCVFGTLPALEPRILPFLRRHGPTEVYTRGDIILERLREYHDVFTPEHLVRRRVRLVAVFDRSTGTPACNRYGVPKGYDHWNHAHLSPPPR